MPLNFRCFTTGLAFLLLGSPTPVAGAPRSRTVPLVPDAWTATDSIRFGLLPRPPRALHQPGCRPGARGGDGERHAGSRRGRQRHHELPGRGVPRGVAAVLQRRVPAAGSQRHRRKRCSTARRSTAWASPGRCITATAPMRSPRSREIGGSIVRVELDGPVARLFVDTATTPTLVVPRVVASGGAGLGVWAGAFGRGAYFSNVRYAAAPGSSRRHGRRRPAAGDDARLGDLRRDRGRRLHARRHFPTSAGSPGSGSRRSPKGSC